jgi:hypothetical protein
MKSLLFCWQSLLVWAYPGSEALATENIMQIFRPRLGGLRGYLHSGKILRSLCRYGLGTILVILAIIGSQAFRTTPQASPDLFNSTEAAAVSRHSTLNAKVFLKFVNESSQRMYPRLSREIVDSAIKHSEKYDLSPILVLAIIKTESEFYPFALSKQNAKGLMQINPAANQELLVKEGIFKDPADIFDPDRSIEAGCFLLRRFINESPDFNTALDNYLGADSVPYKAQIHKEMGKILLVGITEELNKTSNHKINPIVKVEPRISAAKIAVK